MNDANFDIRRTFVRVMWTSPLLASLLAACGGGGGDSTPPPATPQGSTLPAIAPAVALDDNHQVGATTFADGDTASGGQGAPVDGIACEPENRTYHIHTHLSIFLDGQALAVPTNVGIVGTGASQCLYHVHTHDRSGKVHVEAPAAGTFTLGNFFAIWGQPLTTDNVAGMTGKPIVFYVTDNGTVTQFSGDPKTIELASHRHIAIQIGTTLTQVPMFTWTGS